jgi:hypothetical protein
MLEQVEIVTRRTAPVIGELGVRARIGLKAGCTVFH